jgi:hypothetical protein
MKDTDIIKVVQWCTKLTQLELKGTKFSNAAILAVGTLYVHIDLYTLKLSSDPSFLYPLLSSSTQQIHSCHHLEEFHIECNWQKSLENCGASLHKLAFGCPNLHLLFFYDCPNTQTFEASNFTNLQVLGFVNCQIAQSFSKAVLPSLKTLTMYSCFMEDPILITISHICPALGSCDLQGNIGLTDVSVLKLVENCSELATLCLIEYYAVTTELKHKLSLLGLSIED